MRFVFGNNIPCSFVEEVAGQKQVREIFGLPSDRNYEEIRREGSFSYLHATKIGSRPVLFKVAQSDLDAYFKKG